MNKKIKHESDNVKSSDSFLHFLMTQCLSIRRWALLVSLLLYLAFAVMDVLKFPSEVYSLTLATRFFFSHITSNIFKYYLLVLSSHFNSCKFININNGLYSEWVKSYGNFLPF